MKRKSTEVVPGAQPTARSDNPLVDGNMSIELIRDYALFLCDVAAHDPGDAPSDEVLHGRYLALRTLTDALEAVCRPAEGGVS